MVASGRVTLHDVARESGVSKSSVSNVIRNHPHVRDEVRARVEAAIERLGYRPQAIGQNLVSGKTGLIALAIPNFAQPYFAEFARAAVAAAGVRGARLLVLQTDNDLEREREIADAWSLGAADGLIFSPSSITDEEIERRRAGMPLVLLGERSKLVTVDRVGIDSVEIARLATAHLIDRGRTRIAMIGDKDFGDRFVVSERQEGYRRALEAAGLSPAAEVQGVQDWTREDGVAAMERLLDRGDRIDAVFCANDLLALGALAALRRRGVRVPDDMAVIGIDDIEEASYSNPGLSTVMIDRTWMAEQAIRLLLTRLDDSEVAPQQLAVPHALRVRESTGGSVVRSDGS